MSYTVSKIKNIRTCAFKGFLSQAGYHQEQPKSLHILDLYKEALSDNNLKEYGKFFDDNINMKFYDFQQQLEVDRNIFIIQLTRIKDYLYYYNGKVIDSNVKKKIKILDKEVLVKADLVIQFPDKIELVKLSASNPKLSYSARSDDNKPENSFELHLMQLLAQELYPHTEASSAFYHLQGKHDGKDSKDKDNRQDYEDWLKGESNLLRDKLSSLESERDAFYNEGKKRDGNKIHTKVKKLASILDFEPPMSDGKPLGSHIIRQDNPNLDYILNELQEVFNTELNMNSEKCVSNDCKSCKHYVLCQAKQHVSVKLEKVKEDKKTGFGKKKSSPTESQQRLINFKEGYLRASAIPGAGKSFSIVQRLGKLLESNNPSDILMITFTNMASEEMKERVYKLTDGKYKNLNVMTFNSFCMSLIEKEWKYLGYTKCPQLIDKISKMDYIVELLNRDEFSNYDFLNYRLPLLNMPNAKGAVYTMSIHFDMIKAGMFDETTENKYEIYRIYNAYNEMLKSNNQIEYDDQILLGIELLKNKDMIEKYGFKFIMVDEFNDVNLRQIQLLKLFEEYSDFKGLTVVGDPNQSIYQFRLSSPEYMTNFYDYFGQHEDIIMNDNFRSNAEICDLASKYIKLNTKGLHSDMNAFKGVGGHVELVEYDSLTEEYKSIAEYIRDNNDGTNYHEYAVLGRTSKELLEVQKVLDSYSIPSRLATPKKHMDNTNIKLAINLAKYLLTDDFETNDYYLFEYVSQMNPDINNLNELELKVASTKDMISESEDFGIDRIEIFLELIYELTMYDNDANAFINDLYNSREWYTFSEFANHLIKHVKYNSDSQSEKDDVKYNCVTLNSYHSAKGLQYNKLFLLMDKFDYAYDKTELEDLEEQRRLFYVGISRSETWLRMVWNNQSDKKRRSIKCEQLVREIGEILNG